MQRDTQSHWTEIVEPESLFDNRMRKRLNDRQLAALPVSVKTNLPADCTLRGYLVRLVKVPSFEPTADRLCWISDTKNTYSHYDVEHFRPKKEAKNLDKTKRDGYWWLAFEYSNYRLCGNVGNSKKGGWFPLRTGSLCATFDDQCEESETRYFLDPTDPADVELVAFDEEGNLIPAPGCCEWEAERVTESEKRLKLNEHEMLTEARREIWARMSQKIDLYRKAKARCTKNRNPAAEADVRRLLREIKKMLNPTADLSSVAKWCILFRNDVQLWKLVT